MVVLTQESLIVKALQVNTSDFTFGKEINGLPDSYIFEASSDLSYFSISSDGTRKHFMLIDYAEMSIIYNRTVSSTNVAIVSDYSEANNAIAILSASRKRFFLEVVRTNPAAPTTPSENENTPQTEEEKTIAEQLLSLLQDPLNIVLMLTIFLIGSLFGVLLLRGKIGKPQINSETRSDDSLKPLTPKDASISNSGKEEPKKEKPKKEKPKKEKPKKEENK